MIVVWPGSSFAYTPVAIGSPAPTITAAHLPPWISLVAGVLTGTAPTGLTGATSFPLTLTATNTAGSASQNVVISVIYQAT